MIRRLATSFFVLLTFALAAVGMVYAVHGSWIGFALHLAAIVSAVIAWFCLGMPVRRSDISKGS